MENDDQVMMDFSGISKTLYNSYIYYNYYS